LVIGEKSTIGLVPPHVHAPICRRHSGTPLPIIGG
jgi:hypothetical protein